MAIKRKAAFSIGANLGDKAVTLRRAVEMLSARIGRIVSVSSLYATKPLNPPGNKDMQQPDFLNAALVIETSLEVPQIFSITQAIETALGLDRSKKIAWGPREIDIDILTVGEIITSSAELSLPHPEMTKRDFVLVPLKEAYPDFIHPVSKQTIDELIGELSEKSVVGKLSFDLKS